MTVDINDQWGNILPIKRPIQLRGFTDVKETPLGKLFLTLNMLEGHPVELFAQIGKAGSDVSAFTEAVARLVSLALRCGVAPQEVADQLVGIGGSRSVGFGLNRVRSVPDAIGQFLAENQQCEGSDIPLEGPVPVRVEAAATKEAAAPAVTDAGLCPECGQATLVEQEGCKKCFSCGHSEC